MDIYESIYKKHWFVLAIKSKRLLDSVFRPELYPKGIQIAVREFEAALKGLSMKPETPAYILSNRYRGMGYTELKALLITGVPDEDRVKFQFALLCAPRQPEVRVDPTR